MKQINQMEWSIDSEIDVNITLRELFLADVALNVLGEESDEVSIYISQYYPKIFDKIFCEGHSFDYDASHLINSIETILSRYNIGG